MMSTKSHYFFTIPSSPWPILSSIFSFNFVFSLLLFFKYQNSFVFFFNLILIFFCALNWWVYYGEEFNLTGSNSFNLESGVKMSMILFISSEVFFFFSFFWSYFHFFLSPSLDLGMSWPPQLLIMFNCINVPLINTAVLLSSGVTVTISHNFLMTGQLKLYSLFLGLTVVLGVLFSILQLMEYSSSFFSINDGTFGTSFFMLTGFHGIHVLVGTMFLFFVLVRSLNLSSSTSNSLSFELSSWYWHFVDVVWIFLYFFIYYLNS